MQNTATMSPAERNTLDLLNFTAAALNRPDVSLQPPAQTSNWTPLVNLVGEKLAADFMFMGACEGLNLYKHVNTRRYLNIDCSTGQTFRFVPQEKGYEPITHGEAIQYVLS